ncbi:DUF4139 domain-containing protein [Porphyrobacter algicida]|uniref:DUF4139 domain-containing protein n=1 Tax=Qipengyuania algicida TaxID=1836209 RepID=A0A845AN36_9SPHN|nr:DUF4139 domain-containing protein [Qipengyuania algicida]MXP29916.1 DUF4139 domain-containing protein [Qipengyuania algicida]
MKFGNARYFALACACAASSAAAQDRDLSVTIYSNDIALVQDARHLDIAKGRQVLEFPDVSARIQPATVQLTASNIGIVEQNFDFDLLTPGKLMEKAVGHTVTIVRTNPATGAETREQAKVLATNGGVVLQIGNHIEVLRDDGLPTRVIFDRVPDNLRARPTLSVTVDSGQASKRSARLSYLTTGLGWHADYVALYDEAEGAIDVQGWVTLTNTSGTTYDNADTILVAGSPNLGVDAPSRYNQYQRRQTRGTIVQAGTESGTRERLGDYYLYPLGERTTIAEKQTKQVSFLDVHGIPAQHGYEYSNRWLGSANEPESAQTVYRFSTSGHQGLGDQLPAGTLRFYMRDKRGEPQFVGESEVSHTPMGSMLSLSTGYAFDVKVKPVVVKRISTGPFHWQTTMKYTLTNALPRAVTVDLMQDGLWGDVRIVSESQKSERTSADVATWHVKVPANGTAEVDAVFDSRF